MDSAASPKSRNRKMFMPTGSRSCKRSLRLGWRCTERQTALRCSRGSPMGSCSRCWLYHSDQSSASDQVTSALCGCCETCLAAAHFESSVVFWCFFFSKLNKLEQLEELNLSGNKLKTIPTTIANCKRLHTLAAHSNNISIFPEILQLPQIQVLVGPSGGNSKSASEVVLH